MTVSYTVDTSLSDAEILDQAATTIATPRVEAGDSFVLHAPLEVLARSALLTLVAPDGRDPVRNRIATVAGTYQQWGSPLDRQPHHPPSLSGNADQVLVRALNTGDLEAADDAITWLAARLDPLELVRTLAGPVLPSLSAAAHGPILLYLLPRVAARSLPAAAMARTTIHELGRHPQWKLSWFDQPATAQQPDPARELTRRLAAPHLEEKLSNNFIQPTMAATERGGLAYETLADLTTNLTVTAARHCLLRVAAHSMIQDDPQHAPYGWSHCLTMPQAALGVAHATDQPQRAVAVAATYVLGFRASLGSAHLDPDYVPERAEVHPEEAIHAPPAVAAGAAWHTPVEERAALWRVLAGNAAAHHDAHLAKYTLACFDAGRGDPDHQHLYLAAAGYLNAWWTHHADQNAGS